MILKLVKTSVFVFVLMVGNVQADSAYQAPLVTESLLLDIKVQKEGLIAVGDRGHIIRSKDGKNWTQEVVPVTSMLTAVHVEGDMAWAVGHDATILRQNGMDQPWQIKMFNPEIERPLLDVLFFDQQHGIAIGAYGLFIRTRDGGETWQVEMHPEFLSREDQAYLQEIKQEDEAFYLEELNSILPHLNRVSRAGDKLYLAGESGLLAFSDDFGQSWQRMDVNYLGSFFDIRETQQGRLIAAALRGNIFEYKQNENRWAFIDSNSAVSLNSVVSLDGSHTAIVGNNGSIVCLHQDNVLTHQTDDNQAIVNAVLFNQQVIAVTAQGIKTILEGSNNSPCNRTKK